MVRTVSRERGGLEIREVTGALMRNNNRTFGFYFEWDGGTLSVEERETETLSDLSLWTSF